MNLIIFNKLIRQFFKNLEKYMKTNYIGDPQQPTIVLMRKYLINIFQQHFQYDIDFWRCYIDVSISSRIYEYNKDHEQRFVRINDTIPNDLVKSIFMTLNDIIYNSELSLKHQDIMNFTIFRILQSIK